MQSGWLLPRLISVKHIHNSAYPSPSIFASLSISLTLFVNLCVFPAFLALAYSTFPLEGKKENNNKKKVEYGFKYVDEIHNLACCRVRKLFPFYAILNRINYAFYNATEILKIIDVDSEMISGIIFVIYEDIFMSLFLAFRSLFHHNSYTFAAVAPPQRIAWTKLWIDYFEMVCVTPRISELKQKLCIWICG